MATLTEALIAAFSHRAEPLPAAALAEAPVFPPSTLVHLGWVVRHLAHVDGYISAAGQETCLTVYGGQQFAAGLDRLSDEFRRIEAPSAAVAQPTCRRLTITYGDVSAAEAHPLPENIPKHEDGAGRQANVAQDRAEPAPSTPPPVEGADSEAEPLEAGAADEAPAIGSPSPAALAWLTTIDLSAEFRERLPTLHSVPRFLTAGVRRSLTRCLADLQVAMRRRDEASRETAWKLFLLAPRLLLARCRDTGPVGRSTLLRRVELLESGQWEQLLREARAGRLCAPC